MTIREWLADAANELADAMIPSARLDAEIILAHTINRPRTWLHAHGDEPLDPRRRDIADARVELRLERVPVAYIIGHKEFYGRRFQVTTDTLIPRPESEAVVELLNSWLENTSATQLIDVGTGSGCLGITAKLEHPQLMVTLSDISKDALKIARKNANLLDADVQFLASNLLGEYPLKADIVLANLPYVDRSWHVSDDTWHEPDSALYAENGGLALIKQLIDQAPDSLAAHGALILEADPRQHARIIDHAETRGFTLVTQRDFGLLLSYSS